MLPPRLDSSDDNDLPASEDLMKLVTSWDTSSRSEQNEPSKVIHLNLSQDLTDYINTGVDPTGRYSKPATFKEKAGIAFIYALIVAMILVGLFGGSEGHKLFEALLHLIRPS